MNTEPATPPPRRKWHLQRWLLLLAASPLAYAGWTQYTFRSAIEEAKALGWTVDYTYPIEVVQKNWRAIFQIGTWTDGVVSVNVPTGEQFEQHHDIVYRLNPRVLEIEKAQPLRDLSALKRSTRLERLGISSGSNLTNVDALSNCTALNDVSLWNCSALTDLAGLTNNTALETLSLTGGKGLTNVDALKSLPALKILWLNGCTGLTNVAALKNLTALEEVNLVNCTKLTNVDALKNLPALQLVHLSGCTGLTKESIEALKAALPNTTILTDKPPAPKPPNP